MIYIKAFQIENALIIEYNDGRFMFDTNLNNIGNRLKTHITKFDNAILVSNDSISTKTKTEIYRASEKYCFAIKDIGEKLNC